VGARSCLRLCCMVSCDKRKQDQQLSAWAGHAMPITIQLDDDLADQLQRRAACRQLSLEEFALRLLGGALGELEAAETWELHNRRRLTLDPQEPGKRLERVRTSRVTRPSGHPGSTFGTYR